MLDYFITYMGSNIICLIIFGIMLVHDLRSVDRQEKQIKYDHALIAFMLYFVSDCFWAAVYSGILPKTRVSITITDVVNYFLMAAITYTWLRYVMAVEQVENRDTRRMKFFSLLPFGISTVIMICMYIFTPTLMISETLEVQPAAYVFLVVVPYIYIAAVLFYTLRRAKREENPSEKKKHLGVGLFPLVVVVGGLVEMLLSNDKPLFCFSCTILMLIFYIQSMENRISIDPLTRLNNRGQLNHYVSQRSNMIREGRSTFFIMMDINNFKMINDTYGHAEGDRVLVVVSDTLMKAVKNRSLPVFLGRYGGDEFVIIAHPESDEEIPELIADIREELEKICTGAGMPYIVTLAAGYDRLTGENDTYQRCLQRADSNMYLDKKKKREGEPK